MGGGDIASLSAPDLWEEFFFENDYDKMLRVTFLNADGEAACTDEEVKTLAAFLERMSYVHLEAPDDAPDDGRINAYFRVPFVWAAQETLKMPADCAPRISILSCHKSETAFCIEIFTFSQKVIYYIWIKHRFS